MSEVFSVNCKNCGAGAYFDAKTQKIRCDACGKSYKISEYNECDDIIDDGDEDYNYESTEINIENFNYDVKAFDLGKHSFGNESLEEMSVYTCEKCGAQVLASNVSGTAKCPFCDNNLVFSEKFAGDLRPDLIIPFKKNKEDALAAYEEFIKKRDTFIPSVFKKENHIEEIQGIYVPYWIYDADFDLRYLYKTKKIETWEKFIFEITRTSYFDCIREGNISYKNLPRDASSRMRNDLMDSLEPYDISEAEDFSTYYVAGYLAERFDVPAEGTIKEAVKRMETTIRKEVEETVVGYNERKKAGEELKLDNGKIRYAMYPVWYLNTNYRGKSYSFAMNGQTGKMVGDKLPLDWLSLLIIYIIIGGILGVVCGVIGLCAGGFLGLAIGLLLGLAIAVAITVGWANADRKSIEKKDEAKDYISGELHLTRKEDKLKKRHTKIRLINKD